ncbi:MAG: alpha/beta hydrolase [Cyclobacteriaceae bacterium]|nr:alpha/beta hydrolase [Cyclobacteriaceae bacterium]
MKGKIFFLSGLGADKRAFDALKLNFNNRIKHVEWLFPTKKETFNHYAKRIVDHYQITQSDVLVGLSFGGLMAVEIQHILNNDKVILISSASYRKELHPFFRFTSRLHLNRLIPKRKFNQPNQLIYKGFSIKTESHKQLLNSIFKDTNVDFVQWAIRQMGHWKRKKRSNAIVKIHGDKDLMIPIHNSNNDYTIKGGGHFMVVDRAEEVSNILNKIIT